MTFEDQGPATFFLSVDVSRQIESSPIVSRIHEILRRHQIRAMWSFEFEKDLRVIESVPSSASDIGILATDSWAHPKGDRTLFARELLARVNRANDLGVKPIALALSLHDSPGHFDL